MTKTEFTKCRFRRTEKELERSEKVFVVEFFLFALVYVFLLILILFISTT